MARIEQSIELSVPVRAAYAQLMQFEQYPRFMDDMKEVRQIDDTHLHWHAKSGAAELEWDAEITEQVPERSIAWRNTSGPRYEGKLELQETAPERTRLTLVLEYDPKQQVLAQHGKAETMIAQRAEHDLQRFKKFMEQLVHGHGEGAPQDRKQEAERRTGGEAIGKTIAQTADERREGARTGRAATAARSTVGNGQAEGPQSWLPDLFQVWDGPFSMMRRMSEDMERFIERFMPPSAGNPPQQHSGNWSPAVETAQRDNQFVVCAELAGVKRDNVQVEIHDGRLTIEGERHPEAPHAPQEYRRSERAYGRFYREIALPPGANADAASASMQDGLLEITVPIEHMPQRGRRIEIQTPQ